MTRAGAVLDRANDRLDVTAARIGALDPAVQLARGWSITRTADGRLVRSVADVGPGRLITTAVADGQIDSTVDNTSPRTHPATDTKDASP